MSSETPRTDAQTHYVIQGNLRTVGVEIDFARQLERELVASQKDRDACSNALVEVEAQLTTALAEVAREREANAELARMLNIARDVIRANDLKEIERLGNPFADPSHVQAIEQRDALRERVRRLTAAGERMAEYLLPQSPISTEEPTERDWLIGDWETAKAEPLAATSPQDVKKEGA